MRFLLFVAILLAATPAFGALEFNQNVTGGVLYGTGNSNGGFTVERNSSTGIELGLRAHTRFPDARDDALGIKSQGNGTYGSFDAIAYVTGRASWNFDFSINNNYNNVNVSPSPLALNQYQLSIDYDPGVGTNFLSFDPLSIPDNAGLPNIAQNSEQLNFFSGPLPFNPTANGLYDIRLRSLSEGGPDVTIHVLVGTGPEQGSVPEPASLAIWGSLATVGLVVRRYRK